MPSPIWRRGWPCSNGADRRSPPSEVEQGNHPGRSIVYSYVTEHLPRRHRIVLAIVLAVSALIAGAWALVG
jgi:hypothetical protein